MSGLVIESWITQNMSRSCKIVDDSNLVILMNTFSSLILRDFSNKCKQEVYLSSLFYVRRTTSECQNVMKGKVLSALTKELGVLVEKTKFV
jgi:hypothetical protein